MDLLRILAGAVAGAIVIGLILVQPFMIAGWITGGMLFGGGTFGRPGVIGAYTGMAAAPVIGAVIGFIVVRPERKFAGR